jgi:hypothetical protein
MREASCGSMMPAIILFYWFILSQCLQRQHVSGILRQHDDCHNFVIINYQLLIIWCLQVALAEALADEAEGLARELMGAVEDLQAELKGALHLCHTAALPHTPHGRTLPLALPLGQTIITDSLQHYIVTACVVVPCTHVTVAARAQRRIFRPSRRTSTCAHYMIWLGDWI